MDNTFENGFMCGLLLSLNKKENSKIKDPIFREILENGIPVASVKLSNHYKIVYTLYHDTKYPQFDNTHCELILPGHYNTTVEEVCIKDESGSYIYPVGHSEMYGYSYGPLVLFAIFYKDDNPMVADYMGSYNYISPTFKMETIYYYPDGAYAYKYDYVKEKVIWKQKDRLFMKDQLEYLGDYTLKPAVNNVNSSGSYIIINGLLDKDGNLISNNLTVSIPIHTINYTATYPTYINEQGSEVKDNSKRPIITKSSESDSTQSITIKYDKQYIDSSYPKYSDLTIQEIFDMNVDIAKDIRETLGDRGCYTAKKAICLN